MFPYPRCDSVFITGCNRGLGLEFVKQFLSLKTPPAHIFATCRSLEAEGASQLKDLAVTASNLHLLELDVDDLDAIQRVSSKVSEILGHEGLNLLLNNAGSNGPGTLEKVTVEKMMKSYQTNCVAPLMITQALLPLLKRAADDDKSESCPRAAIVNMSSILGSIEENEDGSASEHGGYPYRASKCALNIVTKSMSVDLKEAGICAIVVHPGWVCTDMGGPMALQTTNQSASAIMEVIASLDLDKTGRWFLYNGEDVPW